MFDHTCFQYNICLDHPSYLSIHLLSIYLYIPLLSIYLSNLYLSIYPSFIYLATFYLYKRICSATNHLFTCLSPLYIYPSILILSIYCILIYLSLFHGGLSQWARSNRPMIWPGTVKSLIAPWELSQLALARDYANKIDPWLGRRTVPWDRVSTRVIWQAGTNWAGPVRIQIYYGDRVICPLTI